MMKMAMLAMRWISKDEEANSKCFSGSNVNKREMYLQVETVIQPLSSITRFTSSEVRIRMKTFLMTSLLLVSSRLTKKR